MQKPPYIIYSDQALQFYDMLGIRKERIDPGEPWQNYVRRVGIYRNPCTMQERSWA